MTFIIIISIIIILMQSRNIRGQYQKVKEDMFSLLDILALLWKLLPFFILFMVTYNYYDLGANFRIALFKIICNKDGSDCGCKLSQEKSNGGW